jgi:hypothetical protein
MVSISSSNATRCSSVSCCTSLINKPEPIAPTETGGDADSATRVMGAATVGSTDGDVTGAGVTATGPVLCPA